MKVLGALLLLGGLGVTLAPVGARTAPTPPRRDLTIRFAPPPIPVDRAHEPREFQIEVRSSGAPVQVELVLTAEGGAARRYVGRSTNGRTYRVTAVPALRSEANTLLLTLVDAGSETVFQARERSFAIGGRTVRLSQVRRIEF